MKILLRLTLLLCICATADVLASPQSNGKFWNPQSDAGSFLGLPADAQISDLKLTILNQSTKYVYVLVRGKVRAEISESSLRSKYRKFLSELELYEDDFLGENLISKQELKISLPFKGKKGKIVKFSVYEGKFSVKTRVKLSDIKAKLGPMDKPILKAKLNVFERISKETQKSNTVDIDLNKRSTGTRHALPTRNTEHNPQDAFSADFEN